MPSLGEFEPLGFQGVCRYDPSKSLGTVRAEHVVMLDKKPSLYSFHRHRDNSKWMQKKKTWSAESLDFRVVGLGVADWNNAAELDRPDLGVNAGIWGLVDVSESPQAQA